MRVAREKCKIDFFKGSFGIVYKKLLLLIKINKSWGILVRNFRKRHENILEIILFWEMVGKLNSLHWQQKTCSVCISETIDQKERGIWTCKHIWNCWKAGKVMHEGEVKTLNSSVYGLFCKILHRCHGLFSLRIVEMGNCGEEMRN